MGDFSLASIHAGESESSCSLGIGGPHSEPLGEKTLMYEVALPIASSWIASSRQPEYWSLLASGF